jgi:hypothetical protein
MFVAGRIARPGYHKRVYVRIYGQAGEATRIQEYCRYLLVFPALPLCTRVHNCSRRVTLLAEYF